jgi:hypothetical protein
VPVHMSQKHTLAGQQSAAPPLAASESAAAVPSAAAILFTCFFRLSLLTFNSLLCRNCSSSALCRRCRNRCKTAPFPPRPSLRPAGKRTFPAAFPPLPAVSRPRIPPHPRLRNREIQLSLPLFCSPVAFPLLLFPLAGSLRLHAFALQLSALRNTQRMYPRAHAGCGFADPGWAVHYRFMGVQARRVLWYHHPRTR